MKFGGLLRQLRMAKQMTQRDLAARVAARLKEEDRRGFDFTYLSKIENDRLPPPSVAAILQIAAILGTDSDELLAVAGKAPPDLGEKLRDHPTARAFFRSAIDELSEEDWKKLLSQVRAKKQK